jgi:hypothetical protein
VIVYVRRYFSPISFFMKKQQIIRKISLNKRILSLLDSKDMQAIKGGANNLMTDPMISRNCPTYYSCV